MNWFRHHYIVFVLFATLSFSIFVSQEARTDFLFSSSGNYKFLNQLLCCTEEFYSSTIQPGGGEEMNLQISNDSSNKEVSLFYRTPEEKLRSYLHSHLNLTFNSVFHLQKIPFSEHGDDG